MNFRSLLPLSYLLVLGSGLPAFGCGGGDADQSEDESSAPKCDGTLPGARVSGQADMQKLEGVREVQGNFYIHSQPEDPVTSLSALRCLESVTGDFELYNTEATSLEDLKTLTTVGENFLISGNGNLTDLQGLESLTSVGDLFRISLNASLLNLSGVENLVTIGGTLGIHENSILTSIAGLSGVTTVGNNVAIWGNPELPRCLINKWAEGVDIGTETAITSFDDGNSSNTSACTP